jgi:glycosyltransferase involved in cell wall biosynthesis
MACGTPVLAARAGALPEVVGEAALLVDPLRIEAIRAGLTQLARDPSLAADLGRRGPLRAAEFNWQATAATVTEALLGCC